MREKREIIGLTQEQLAQELRCHQSKIAAYECGYCKPVDLHRLDLIEEILGGVVWKRVKVKGKRK